MQINLLNITWSLLSWRPVLVATILSTGLVALRKRNEGVLTPMRVVTSTTKWSKSRLLLIPRWKITTSISTRAKSTTRRRSTERELPSMVRLFSKSISHLLGLYFWCLFINRLGFGCHGKFRIFTFIFFDSQSLKCWVGRRTLFNLIQMRHSII